MALVQRSCSKIIEAIYLHYQSFQNLYQHFFLPLIQTSQETFLFEKHLQKWKQVVRFEPLIFMTTFFEIQISHRSRRHSKKKIKKQY